MGKKERDQGFVGKKKETRGLWARRKRPGGLWVRRKRPGVFGQEERDLGVVGKKKDKLAGQSLLRGQTAVSHSSDGQMSLHSFQIYRVCISPVGALI